MNKRLGSSSRSKKQDKTRELNNKKQQRAWQCQLAVSASGSGRKRVREAGLDTKQLPPAAKPPFADLLTC